MSRLVGALRAGFLVLLVTAFGVWATLALYFSGPPNAALRNGLAAGVLLALLLTLAALVLGRSQWRWPAVAAFAALMSGVLVWFFGLQASNDRDWRTEVAVLPYATIEGDTVTVHNIRNFDYRSELDFTPAHYDKRFDLNKFEGVDIISVYWMGPHVAHVFLSFAFAGDEHLAISIETRTEKGEGYSTLKGFFRQYELHYVVADERDVIRVRTNYRRDPPEDVYVYRAAGTPEAGRKLFLEYMRQMNELKERPAFYNTLTTNCTTNMWVNARINAQHVPLSWKVLASGHVPEYLFEQGRLVTDGLSFAELQRRAHVNARAQAADQATDFSRRIRTTVLTSAQGPAAPVGVKPEAVRP